MPTAPRRSPARRHHQGPVSRGAAAGSGSAAPAPWAPSGSGRCPAARRRRHRRPTAAPSGRKRSRGRSPIAASSWALVTRLGRSWPSIMLRRASAKSVISLTSKCCGVYRRRRAIASKAARVAGRLDPLARHAYSTAVPRAAWWQSGYAADCKSAYAGSIPAQASTTLGSAICGPCLGRERSVKTPRLRRPATAGRDAILFRSSSAVEQATVNRRVAGSNPCLRSQFWARSQPGRGPFLRAELAMATRMAPAQRNGRAGPATRSRSRATSTSAATSSATALHKGGQSARHQARGVRARHRRRPCCPTIRGATRSC